MATAAAKIIAASPVLSAYRESQTWDVAPCLRGLTVIMDDGKVVPLSMSQGAAKSLAHSWSFDVERAG